jgi:peptidoglycan/LPS O-acetylase OafA/YrhL
MGTVRFLLALSVVVTHANGGTLFGYTIFSGVTAVQCFYVISGFLITMRLNEAKGYESVANFYLSRYLRLWPAYIVVALPALIFFMRPAMFSALPTVAGPFEIFAIWFANITLFFQDWFLFFRLENGHFVPTASFQAEPGIPLWRFLLVPQAWTLGIELTFYAIAPFVCRRWWSVTLLLLFGLTSRLIVAQYQPVIDPWIYRFAPSEMLLFGAGGLAYFAGRHIFPSWPRTTRVLCVFAVLAFLLLVFAHSLFVNVGLVQVSAALLLTYPLVLVFMVLTASPLFYGTRNNRLDRDLGELSYPMYISHILVVQIFVVYVPESVQWGNALYVLAVLALSQLLVLFIIKPVDRGFRGRLGSQSMFSRQAHGTTSLSRPDYAAGR